MIISFLIMLNYLLNIGRHKHFLRLCENILLRYAVVIFLGMLPLLANGQSVMIKGVITDKTTGLPLSHVNIGFDNKSPQTSSDLNGHYKLMSRGVEHEIYFRAIGFRKQFTSIAKGQPAEVNIQMDPLNQELAEISIKSNVKKRYHNANNPAVEFMRQVIQHKEENSSSVHKEISYRQYEKINLSISIPTAKAKTWGFLKKLPFLLDNSDSLSVPGKKLIPVFMQEKLNLIRHSALNKDTVITLGEKHSRIDQYLDEDGIDEYLEKIYQRADVYDNDIGLGNQRFLSPIAGMATTFYKYFIVDTIKDVSPRLLKMMIAPKNKQDILFLGYLYITLDGHYAVKRAELSINSEINLNWVKDLHFSLDYQADDTGRYHLAKSVMAMDLGIFKEGTSIFGERTIIAHDFLHGEPAWAQNPDPLGKGNLQSDTLWAQLRPEPLSKNDQIAYGNIDSLKHSKIFLHKMAVASFLLSGFIPAGKLEFGPFSSFYSFNPVEGKRFKFGARTTEGFSKKLFFDGNLAYGTKDKQWKYNVAATLSLTDKSIYQFPVQSIMLRHSYEAQIPGQELNLVDDDNFLLSFKRGSNNKWLYNKKWLLEYFYETPQHVSFRLGYKNQNFKPAGDLLFRQLSGSVSDLRTSEFSAEIRWAPHETFYQGKRFRRPIINGYPVFTLRGTVGVKNLLGGDYSYQNINLNISKRFYLSVFGYSDVIVETGAVFGRVPFPLLHIHRANQTYAYQLPSYNLMNFMEFVSDRYASINIQHSFNGLLFNKIPLIKALQWREILSLKVLKGTLSSQNDPAKNADLFKFPINSHGLPITRAFGTMPYIEGSVGVSNVFKFLRVDLVRRFNYLDGPGIAKWGIRAKINVDF